MRNIDIQKKASRFHDLNREHQRTSPSVSHSYLPLRARENVVSMVEVALRANISLPREIMYDVVSLDTPSSTGGPRVIWKGFP